MLVSVRLVTRSDDGDVFAGTPLEGYTQMLFHSWWRRLVVGVCVEVRRGRVGANAAMAGGEVLERRCLLAAPQTFELASLLPDNGGDGSS